MFGVGFLRVQVPYSTPRPGADTKSCQAASDREVAESDRLFECAPPPV